MRSRSGFTMIELIFVIVILGILASVAVPKFLHAKDSAKAVTEVANLRTAIGDISSAYLLADDKNSSLPQFLDYHITCFNYWVNDNNHTMIIGTQNTTDTICQSAISEANASGLLSDRTF